MYQLCIEKVGQFVWSLHFVDPNKKDTLRESIHAGTIKVVDKKLCLHAENVFFLKEDLKEILTFMENQTENYNDYF